MTFNLCLFLNKLPTLTLPTGSPCGYPQFPFPLVPFCFWFFLTNMMQDCRLHIEEADSRYCIITGCNCTTSCVGFLERPASLQHTSKTSILWWCDSQAKLVSQSKVAKMSSHLRRKLRDCVSPSTVWMCFQWYMNKQSTYGTNINA